MIKFAQILLIILCSISAIAQAPTFQDTFNEGTLDTTKWVASNYETNNYAGGGSNVTFSPGNISLAGGNLQLTLTQPTAGVSTGAELTSILSFGYGTYEFSMRAGSTSSTSAGTGGPESGQISSTFTIDGATSITEIDAPEIEGIPTRSNNIEWNIWTNGISTPPIPAFNVLTNPEAGFHLYKFIWTPTSINFYIDNVLSSTSTSNIPTAPAVIDINFYGTNSSTWGGLATVGITRYMYVSSVKFWAPTSNFTGYTGGSCSTSPVCAQTVNTTTSISAAFTISSGNGGTGTYYIAANGNDSNNGGSKTTPWLHAPGMPGFTGTYTSHPGDQIIFRGGDTWHFGNSSASPYVGSGGWVWTYSGSSGNPIYIGVDQTWFSGASWTRPILSGDNPVWTGTGFPASCAHPNSGNMVSLGSGALSYVNVDNFEISGFCWTGQAGVNGAAFNIPGGDANLLISNIYCHGWTMTSGSSDNFPCFQTYGSGTVADLNQYVGIVIDGSDSPHFVAGSANCQWFANDPAGCASGQGFNGSHFYDLHDSIVRYVSNIMVTNNCHTIHDNLFEYLYDTFASGSLQQHPNVMNCLGGAAGDNLYWYNNVMRNTFSTENVYFAIRTNLYMFNNVMYNNMNSTDGLVPGGCIRLNAAPTAGASQTAYIYNNTFGDASCIIQLAPNNAPLTYFTGIVNWENNHFIGGATNALSNWYQIDTNGSNGCQATCTITDNGTELYQSTITANGQGYVVANSYAPISSSGSTVDAGTNLGSSCSTFSIDLALCSGTSDAVAEIAHAGGKAASYPAIPIITRPTSPTAWDIGAYQLSSTYATPGPGPLAVSSNKRYLVDQNNNPVFLNGFASQCLFQTLSLTQAASYLSQRQAQGFNAIWVGFLIGCLNNKGETYDNLTPFTNMTNLSGYPNFETSNINEAYWDRMDAMINLAATYGITVFLQDIDVSNEGDIWLLALRANGTSPAYTFGQWLGTRYNSSTFKNIVWLHGNDFQTWWCTTGACSSDDALTYNMANGEWNTDPNHIHTVELSYGTTTPTVCNTSTPYCWSDSFLDPNWRPASRPESQIDLVYTALPTYDEMFTGYSRNLGPTFLGEANYEYEQNNSQLAPGTTQNERRQGWWAATSGGMGQFMGSHCITGFPTNGVSGSGYPCTAVIGTVPGPSWTNNMTTPATIEATYLAGFFNSLSEWYKLVPDTQSNHALLTAGFGTYDTGGNFSTTTYATAALTPDGTLGVIFTPIIQSLTVNMTKFSLPRVSAQWFDPSANTYTPVLGSPFPNTGSRMFTPTGNNKDGDGGWVLLLQATTAPLTPPSPFFSMTLNHNHFACTTSACGETNDLLPDGTNYPLPTVPLGSTRLFGCNEGYQSRGCRWLQVNTGFGNYDFHVINHYLQMLQALGVTDAMAELGDQTPAWAINSATEPSNCDNGTGGDPGCHPPKDISETGCATNNDGLGDCDGQFAGTDLIWRTWVTALAAHFKANTHGVHVAGYEVWNEYTRNADYNGTWSWVGTPQQMRRLAQDARCIIVGKLDPSVNSGLVFGTNESCAAVQATVGLTAPIDPTALMLSPSSNDFGSAAAYLPGENAYFNLPGSAAAADVLSLHTYSHNNTRVELAENTFTDFNSFYAGIMSTGIKTKPIWSSEGDYGGWINLPAIDMEAGYTVKYFMLLQAAGFQRVYLYGYDFTNGTGGGEGGMWLKDGDTYGGSGSYFTCDELVLDQGCLMPSGLTPAHAGGPGLAYQTMVGWLNTATPTTPCAVLSGSIWTCGYTLANHATALAVWDASQTCTNGGSNTNVCWSGSATQYPPSGNLNTQWIQYTDVYGNVTTISGGTLKVDIGYNPILLQTTP